MKPSVDCNAPKTPDWLPGMEQVRIDALECRIGTIENLASAFRLNSLEKRQAALEDWADIRYLPNEADECLTHNCVHDLIAEGMTGVTTHCMESAAALVTVLGTAADKRIDAVVMQSELLQSLVLNVKELVLNIDARLDALESKTPS